LGGFLAQLASLRKQMKMLADELAPSSSSGRPPVVGGPAALPNLTIVLPAGAASVEEAAEGLVAPLSEEALNQMDEQLQMKVLTAQGAPWAALGEEALPSRRRGPPSFSLAFWELATSAGDVLQSFRDELLTQARALFHDVLKDLDTAQLFLGPAGGGPAGEGRRPGGDKEALAARLDAARPHLALPGAAEHLVLLLPEGPAGMALRELLPQVAGSMKYTCFPSESDLLLCFEVAGQAVPDVAEALGGNGAAATLAQHVLSRTDIDWAPLLPTQ
jgi:hypothetical protein